MECPEKNIINVTNIEELDDGSAIITVDYDEQFQTMVKKHYDLKRCTKKSVEKFIIEALKECIKQSYGDSYYAMKDHIKSFKERFKIKSKKKFNLKDRVKFIEDTMLLVDLIQEESV